MSNAPQQSSQWRVRLIVFAIIVLVLVVFIAQNWETVEVRLIIGRTETRLAWALIVAALLGYAAGWLTPKLRR